MKYEVTFDALSRGIVFDDIKASSAEEAEEIAFDTFFDYLGEMEFDFTHVKVEKEEEGW